MTDCPDCAAAERQRWHGMTEACPMCRARHVARLPSYRDSEEAGRLTRTYRDMLAVFKVEHEQVKAAAGRDWMLRART